MPKKHPITNDYTILTRCLGVGVNGKVLECIHKATNEKRALKVGHKRRGAWGIQTHACGREEACLDYMLNLFCFGAYSRNLRSK